MHKFDSAYELFENLVSRLVMLVLCLLTLYALGAAAFELIADLRLGSEFIEKELLQDTDGSILTVLILREFTHSVYTSIKKKSVVIEARAIVLIAVIVVARKLILVDFNRRRSSRSPPMAALRSRTAFCSGCSASRPSAGTMRRARRRPNASATAL